MKDWARLLRAPMEPSSDLLRNPARLAALIERASLVVTDAEKRSRVCDNPAIPDLEVKAYLGVPPTLPSDMSSDRWRHRPDTRARSDAICAAWRCRGNRHARNSAAPRAPFVIPIAI